MAYPQPNADKYAAEGAQFFRINTPVVSGGDIYESGQSCLALGLGPESDVSRVICTYFDDQATDFINQVTLGPDRAFVGRLDANNNDTYSPSHRPGRVLFQVDNLYNPAMVPPDIADITKVNYILVPPNLDVIQYIKPINNTIPTGRNDRTFRFQNIHWKDNGATRGGIVLMIPFYGRRFFSFSIVQDPTTNIGLSYQFFGCNVTYNSPDTTQTPISPDPVTPATATAFNGSYSVGHGPATFDPSNPVFNGLFDYIMLYMTPDNSAITATHGPQVVITTSDVAVPA